MLKNIQNLMEKAGWSAEHSMDVPDVSEGGQEKASAVYQISVHFGVQIL